MLYRIKYKNNVHSRYELQRKKHKWSLFWTTLEMEFTSFNTAYECVGKLKLEMQNYKKADKALKGLFSKPDKTI